MATGQSFRDFIAEVLSDAGDITIKPMMGEYLLYSGGKLFGGLYDDRFLVKKTAKNGKYGMPEAIPYPGAKPMYLVEDAEDKEKVKAIVLDSVPE